MSESTLAPLHLWLSESIDDSVKRAIERIRRADDVRHVAVMPDVHLASDVCVGMALGTSHLLYPSAVGGDIGCGMLAVAFEGQADLLRDPGAAGRMLAKLYAVVPGNRRHRNSTLPMPDDLRAASLSHPSLDSAAREDGAMQLGTLGGGNHFLEFQGDEEGRLWLMLHSGSRAMGQLIRHHHVARAFATSIPGLVALDATTQEGSAYLHDVQWARRYAEANRRAMAEMAIRAVRELLSVEPIESMTLACDHNHVQLERHHGEAMYVHRKGAMPAAAGMPGVVPGSMGTRSYHVEGRGCPTSLESSAHGAGRRFSRAKAREKFSAADVKHQMRDVWFDSRKVQAMREETPHAYKDVRAVLRAQEELVRVTRVLRPVLAYKSG